MRNFILPAALAVLLAAPLCWRIGNEVLPTDAVASLEEESLRRAAGITVTGDDQGQVKLLVAVPLDNQVGPLQVRLGDDGATADIAAPVWINVGTEAGSVKTTTGGFSP